MVGADIANVCNEAALLASLREHDRIEEDDFQEAIERAPWSDDAPADTAL